MLIHPENHTYWSSTAKFLPSSLAPFDDMKVETVGSVILGRHHQYPISLRGFWNSMCMVYAQRNHAPDLATNINGGVAVLTGRFGVFRSTIWKDPEFLSEYLNEYISVLELYKIGPSNEDNDKFYTRWLANHGWDIKIQRGETM
jgi:hypothetical protein